MPFHRFFDLPAELRTQILTLAIPTAQTLPLDDPASHPPLPLLLSHPLIYTPASHAFFTRNTFTATASTLAAVPAPTRRRIRVLTLDIPRLRQVHVSSAVPLLSDALLNGSLRALSISVRGGGFGRGGLPGGLCAALVGVLGDPYLEGAELWVEGVHREGWCEFHPGTRCWREGGRPGFVRVDWRLLAARLGVGVSIVAVGR